MTSKRQYGWKIDGFAKGIDPAEAIKEFERIESLYGSLTPENVLDASKPKNALFHSLFTWDDTRAAENYRLVEARRLLNNIDVRVISDGQPKQIAVFEVVKAPTNVYKSIDTMSVDDIKYVKDRTLKELNILKEKLSRYKEFYAVVKSMTQTIAELMEIP